MKDRDILWCALNLLLDDEEELAQLCPTCRSIAEDQRCVACGTPLTDTDSGQNETFDRARFEALRREARI